MTNTPDERHITALPDDSHLPWLGIRDTIPGIFELLDAADRLSFKLACKGLYSWLRATARVAYIRPKNDGQLSVDAGDFDFETVHPFRAASTIRLVLSIYWILDPPPSGWLARNFPSATGLELRISHRHCTTEATTPLICLGNCFAFGHPIPLGRNIIEPVTEFAPRLAQYVVALGLDILDFKGPLCVLAEMVRLRPTVTEWKTFRSAGICAGRTTQVPAYLHRLTRAILTQLGENCRIHANTGNELLLAEISEYPGHICIVGGVTSVPRYSWPNATSFALGDDSRGFYATERIYTIDSAFAMRFLSLLRLGSVQHLPTEWLKLLKDVCPRLPPTKALELVLRTIDATPIPYWERDRGTVMELLCGCVERDPQGVVSGVKESLMQTDIAEEFAGAIMYARAECDGPVLAALSDIAATQVATARLFLGDSIESYIGAVYTLAYKISRFPSAARSLVRLLRLHPSLSHKAMSISTVVDEVVDRLAIRVLACRDILCDNVDSGYSAYPDVVSLCDDPESVSNAAKAELSRRRMLLYEFLGMCDAVLEAKKRGYNDRYIVGPAAANLAEVCKKVIQAYIDSAPPALLKAIMY